MRSFLKTGLQQKDTSFWRISVSLVNSSRKKKAIIRVPYLSFRSRAAVKVVIPVNGVSENYWYFLKRLTTLGYPFPKSSVAKDMSFWDLLQIINKPQILKIIFCDITVTFFVNL